MGCCFGDLGMEFGMVGVDEAFFSLLCFFFLSLFPFRMKDVGNRDSIWILYIYI